MATSSGSSCSKQVVVRLVDYLVISLAFVVMTTNQIAVVGSASTTIVSTTPAKPEVDRVVVAGPNPRASTAPLASSGMAVELEELLPETAENGTTSRTTVLLGETVLLPCKAYSLGQRTVSWIRRRDWHIMSSGSHIYTADSRFSVLNRPGSPDWILMLRSPQLHDSGTYECQIAGGQGQVSHFVELLVWAPVAFVAEGGEHHVEAESNIQLHCQLRPEANQQYYNNSNSSSSSNNNDTISSSSNATREQMAFHQLMLPTVRGGGAPFVWFHNGKPLIHGGKSSGGLGIVSIYLEGAGESEAAKQIASDWTSWTSRLVIQRADPADSGNYTCTPWRGKAASVSVFVSQGDRPAAVQRQAALRSSIPLNVLIFGLNFLLLKMPLQDR